MCDPFGAGIRRGLTGVHLGADAVLVRQERPDADVRVDTAVGCVEDAVTRIEEALR